MTLDALTPCGHGPSIPAPTATAQTRKLYQACQQFEGFLIASMWNEMESGMGSTLPGASTMQGLGIDSAAMGIADSGGFGLARILYDAVAPRLSGSIDNKGG